MDVAPEAENLAEGRVDAVILNTCGFIQDAKEESIEAILDALNVPGGERPDLQSGHVWQCETVKDGFEEEIFLLHTEGDLRLYVVESFRNP